MSADYKRYWRLTEEYNSFADPKINEELESAQQLIPQLKNKINHLRSHASDFSSSAFENLDNCFALYESIMRKTTNVSTFCSMHLSLDAKNGAASQTESAALQCLYAVMSLWKQMEVLMAGMPEDNFEGYWKSSEARKTKKYTIEKMRKFAWYLPLEQERLVAKLSNYGLKSWSRIYDKIKGKMQIEDNGEVITFAKAVSRRFSLDAASREKSYEHIITMASEQADLCADVLNSMTGWRLDVIEQRNDHINESNLKTEPMQFLDLALSTNDLNQDALNALIDACKTAAPLIQEIKTLKEKYLGISELKSHQIMYPLNLEKFFPDARPQTFSYEQSIDIIAEAVGSIDSSLADFVMMMAQKGWIEAGTEGNRRAGAYCTKLPLSRTPRVYMTFNGSAKDLITLAHELGHAYHAWVLKDQDYFETSYPMTLAETASIFFETIVKDRLIEKHRSDKALCSTIIWQDLTSLMVFLANIPCRFELEKYIYETRQSKTLTPEMLCEKTVELENKWYGENCSDEKGMLWVTTLHYYITERPFYNFPYTFGYLFANKIAQKGKSQNDFFDRYREILLDTGRMSASDLIAKHFQQKIEKSEFWLESIDIAAQRLQDFKNLNL